MRRGVLAILAAPATLMALNSSWTSLPTVDLAGVAVLLGTFSNFPPYPHFLALAPHGRGKDALPDVPLQLGLLTAMGLPRGVPLNLSRRRGYLVIGMTPGPRRMKRNTLDGGQGPGLDAWA